MLLVSELSEPTLSRQQQVLEKRCGALLDRHHTHPMTPTKAGRRMLAVRGHSRIRR